MSTIETRCPRCNAPIQPADRFCPTCSAPLGPGPGASAGPGPAVAGGKDRIAAGVLAILVGGLGVHKFYLGQWGWGLVFLVLCWTGVPSLLGLIDGILILVKNDAEFRAAHVAPAGAFGPIFG